MWTNENRSRHDRSKLRYPGDVTEAGWRIVSPLIPVARRGGNKRTVVMRELVNGVPIVPARDASGRRGQRTSRHAAP